MGGPEEPVRIQAVPAPLRWEPGPPDWRPRGEDALTVTAGPRTDMFADPAGAAPVLGAPRLLAPLSGDFQLSALVTVEFASAFDAGVLLLWAGERSWAKLCFELSPQGEPMIVSVVTRGVSDDCNSFVVDGRQAWLRIARLGQAFAFHASTDGRQWRFVRYFRLDGTAPGESQEVAAGFEAQSPTGDGCTVTFERIRFAPERLGDLRDGG